MFYRAVYELAFDRKAEFFYTNDSDAILAFLQEKFWGESLEIRSRLLCKLFDYDATVNPQFKKDLKIKSSILKQFLTTLLPKEDPPFSTF